MFLMQNYAVSETPPNKSLPSAPNFLLKNIKRRHFGRLEYCLSALFKDNLQTRVFLQRRSR